MLCNVTQIQKKAKKGSNLHYTRVITPRRVTRGGAHLGGLTPRQHSSEEILHRRRAVGNTVSNLTDPGFYSRHPAPMEMS